MFAHDLFVGFEPGKVYQVDFLVLSDGLDFFHGCPMMRVDKVVQVLGYGIPLGEVSEIEPFLNEGFLPGGQEGAVGDSVVVLKGKSQGGGNREFSGRSFRAENDLGHLGTEGGCKGGDASGNAGERQERREDKRTLHDGATAILGSGSGKGNHGEETPDAWLLGVVRQIMKLLVQALQSSEWLLH